MFRIFDIPLVQGNAATLEEPYTVMLNKSSAQRIFGQQSPINQNLRYNDLVNLKVTGVFKDFPYNSHFHPDFLASFATLRDTMIYVLVKNAWRPIGEQLFFHLRAASSGLSGAAIGSTVPCFSRQSDGKRCGKRGHEAAFYLDQTALDAADRHPPALAPQLRVGGEWRHPAGVGFCGHRAVRAADSCVNYMNLSTARASTRPKEIGIRKVAGAQRREIIGQFLGEALLLSLAAVVLAVGLAFAALPLVNRMFEQDCDVSASQVGGLRRRRARWRC